MQNRPKTRNGSQAPLLSVLVPACNEVATLEELLRRVLAVPLDLEVIVVDDGSTDGTGPLLDRLAASEPRLVALHHERNLGKGRALRTALQSARGGISIVQDAHLEYDPMIPRPCWGRSWRGGPMSSTAPASCTRRTATRSTATGWDRSS